MPIALVRTDRSTGAAFGSTTWSATNITSLDPDAADGGDALSYRAHIFFAESRDEITIIADLLFATPSLKAIMVVSDTLRPNDLYVAERVLGGATLTIVRPTDAAIDDDIAALFAAAGPDSLVGMTFRTSTHVSTNTRRTGAFHHACSAELPADLFLLSALALDPDPSFLVAINTTKDVPSEADSLALAHRLVDCRRLWLRPMPAKRAAHTRLVGSLARLGVDLRSSDVWFALAAPAGLLATSRWAYICPQGQDIDAGSSIALCE